jgi:hypothetical protein
MDPPDRPPTAPVSRLPRRCLLPRAHCGAAAPWAPPPAGCSPGSSSATARGTRHYESVEAYNRDEDWVGSPFAGCQHLDITVRTYMSAHRVHMIVWTDAVLEGASWERNVWDPASRDARRKAKSPWHRQHTTRRRINGTSSHSMRREQMKEEREAMRFSHRWPGTFHAIRFRY